MPFTASNQTEDTVAFRDDGGKHFVEPGTEFLLVGDQHAPAAKAAGLTVVWVQSHRDIVEAALAEEEKAKPDPAKPDPEPATQQPKAKQRKASVTVREE